MQTFWKPVNFNGDLFRVAGSVSSALAGAYTALGAKGDVPTVRQGLVVVSMVVVQR